MQIKLLKSLVEELAGTNSAPIVDILFEKKDVNEFLIAKKMSMTINQVRNILYKLSGEGLVSHIRKKDKRKGWYIYFWTLNTEKCLVKIEQALMRKIEMLQGQLKNRELKRYYLCKPCNIEVNEETALAHDFSCEECAEVYSLSDNQEHINRIKESILKTERDLRMIQNELQSIRSIKEKKRVKQDKKSLKKNQKKKKVKKIKKKVKKQKQKKKR